MKEMARERTYLVDEMRTGYPERGVSASVFQDWGGNKVRAEAWRWSSLRCYDPQKEVKVG